MVFQFNRLWKIPALRTIHPQRTYLSLVNSTTCFDLPNSNTKHQLPIREKVLTLGQINNKPLVPEVAL